MEGFNFCVPFIRADNIRILLEGGLANKVMLDSGAYSAWRRGAHIDWNKYYKWTEKWLKYDNAWAVIGDVIDGTEMDNDRLLREWPHGQRGVPVWHLHESYERLRSLTHWGSVCFGSSGDYSHVGSDKWRRRVAGAFDVLRTEQPVKVHMLRGLKIVKTNPEFPFASVDSASVARNFKTLNKSPLQLATEWEQYNCVEEWNANGQAKLLLQQQQAY